MRDLPRLGDQPVIRGEDWDWEPPEPQIPFETLPADHAAVGYIDWAQNDAQVIAFESRGDRLIITISHYDVWRLASVYTDGKLWQKRNIFPVRLEFVGLAECHLVRIVEHGAYQFVRSSWRRPDRFLDVSSLNVICYSPNEIQCVFNLNTRTPRFRRGPRFDHYWDGVDVCIRAHGLLVSEDLRSEWQRLFGSGDLWIFDEFMKLPQSQLPHGYGYRLDAVHDFEAFLKKIGATPRK